MKSSCALVMQTHSTYTSQQCKSCKYIYVFKLHQQKLNQLNNCLGSDWPMSYKTLGLYSLSGWTSYRKILWSLKAARFGLKLRLHGTRQAARLPRCKIET